MSENDDSQFFCSYVSIHYIICECGETFSSEESLRAHLVKEHPHKRERKEYKCGVCESIYNTEKECVAHYEASHLVKEELEQDDQDYPVDIEFEEEVLDEEGSDDKKEPFIVVKQNFKKKSYYNRNIVCEVCGKRYASNAALRYHQRVHTGERPYICSLCPKTFTMPLFLQIHMRTHTGERPYECPDCPKAFSNKAALLRHERVHTGVKPYECPRCGKFFTQSNSMKLHVKTVHLKMPAPYKSKNRRLKAQERLLLKSMTKGIEPDMVIKEEQNCEELEVPEVVFEEGTDNEEVTYEIIYEN